MHPETEPPGMAMAYGVDQKQHELAAIAEWQLMKWQQFARTQRLTLIYDIERGPYLACAWCATHIVWLVDPNGTQFSWEFGQLESALVAHLRNRHRDQEEKVYYG